MAKVLVVHFFCLSTLVDVAVSDDAVAVYVCRVFVRDNFIDSVLSGSGVACGCSDGRGGCLTNF